MTHFTKEEFSCQVYAVTQINIYFQYIIFASTFIRQNCILFILLKKRLTFYINMSLYYTLSYKDKESPITRLILLLQENQQ